MRRTSSFSNAVMIPLPAQPIPGVGPPASTQRTPLNPSKTMSSRVTPPALFSRI